ncbi:HAMP domain-containing sensor histidine kinase [Clostridium sp. Ade.TY]|uniref:sensor histidine kinase n=1 Tax=Clostridium sp. Ade.TY TaxID=1391647 RepID=UPI0004228C86|nr:HAMP domain-containing sensor histidine kinase [Clostridium sp. Ade.TY]
MNKLKYRVTLIFIAFSLMLVFMVGIIANIFIKKNFNSYIEDSINEKKSEIISNISNSYKYGIFDKENINTIGLNAAKQGFIIKLTNNNKEVIWDARKVNKLLCESVLEKNKENTNKINPNINGENTIEKINIKNNNKNIGILQIEYIGPFYYNDSDLIFFDTLNNVLIGVLILAIFFSLIIGIVLSHTISKPIIKVINATKLISEGDYSKKIIYKNKIEEINSMVNSVNKLAYTLSEEDKLRKILTKDISHELRTPLTTIQVQVEALIDGVLEPTEERLKSIYEEIQRLNRLVKSLENLCKYEGDIIKLNKEKINVKDLIETLCINFEKQILDKNISLKLYLSNSFINADKDKISQAIINIISNSIKYTNEYGHINISSYEDNDYTYISIKDDGIGISDNDLKYIFERFYRVDKSRNRKTGGVGVGLTIAKSLVECHEGKIKVNSKLNRGSEFILQLKKE